MCSGAATPYTLIADSCFSGFRVFSLELGAWDFLRVSSFGFRDSRCVQRSCNTLHADKWFPSLPRSQKPRRNSRANGPRNRQALRKQRVTPKMFCTFPYVLVPSRTFSYELVRCRTFSYDAVRSRTFPYTPFSIQAHAYALGTRVQCRLGAANTGRRCDVYGAGDCPRARATLPLLHGHKDHARRECIPQRVDRTRRPGSGTEAFSLVCTAWATRIVGPRASQAAT